MKIFILVFCVLLTSCSSNKYVGKKSSDFTQYSCPIYQVRCGGEDKEIDVKYKVLSLNHNQYLIKGYFRYKETGIAKIFENVEDVRMNFLFIDKGSVIHQELVREQGYIDKKIEFERVFTITKSFDSSSLVDININITQ
ncbi:MAG: hypothetical protein ACI88H_000585 [Cocleimonas sp.]